MLKVKYRLLPAFHRTLNRDISIVSISIRGTSDIPICIRIMKKLEGKIAGIGLATAQQFVMDGAHVFITGRRQSELDVWADNSSKIWARNNRP